MENKAKYTKVGLFVLIFIISMVAFILWLARYDVREISAKEYRLYSKTSVAGLNKNSIVQYKGLDIGTIKNIRINPNNIEEIEIILKITQPQLIKTDSYAIIESQGVTGNKSIEITGGTKNSPILESDNNFLIIPLKKSFFDKITFSADNITSDIEHILKRFKILLNEKNIQNIEELLSNGNASSKNLNVLLKKANILVEKSFPNTLKNIDLMTKDIDKVVNNEISIAAKELAFLSQNFNSLSKDIQFIINTDVKNILKNLKNTSNSSKNIDKVLEELENTMEKIDSTIEEFNNNGGNMLFNTRKIKYGPGEKE